MRGAWIEIIVTSYTAFLCNWSLPVRGAWIEMSAAILNLRSTWSLPVRGAWIEIKDLYDFFCKTVSLPVRGAWIEMPINRAHIGSTSRRSL